MKMKEIIKAIGLIMILIIAGSSLIAQQTYRVQNGSTISVEGTSTLHDWEMTTQEPKGEIVLTRGGNSIAKVDKIEINLKAESLKSDSRRMDNNAYSALNTKSHPEIRFRSAEAREITASHVILHGMLTISGTTKPATIKAEYKINGDRINFSGEHNITFSEFNISAPTAMLGTVRTGDELTVKFDVTFR